MSRVLVVLGLFGKEKIKHQAAKPTWDRRVAGRTSKQSIALSCCLRTIESYPVFEFAYKRRVPHLRGVSLNYEVKDILHCLFIRQQVNPDTIS